MDAVLPLLLLLLGSAAVTDATWCVCRPDMSPAALQKSLDYACGAGADCAPIQTNGACFQPNTVAAHCSYAVNSYYQRKGQAAGSCDFSGTATVMPTDPSSGSCSYPSTPSAAGTGGVTPVPVPGTPTGGATNPPFTPANPPPTAPGLTPTNPGLTPTNPGLSPTTPGVGGFTPGTSTGGGVLGGGVGLGPSGVTTDGTGGAGAPAPTLAAAAAGLLSLTALSLLLQ